MSHEITASWDVLFQQSIGCGNDFLASTLGVVLSELGEGDV